MDTTEKATAKQVLGQYISDIVNEYRREFPDSVFMKDTATAIKYYQDGRKRDSYCMLNGALRKMELDNAFHHLYVAAAHLNANESYDEMWMPSHITVNGSKSSNVSSHLEDAVTKAPKAPFPKFLSAAYESLSNPDDAISIYQSIVDSDNLIFLSTLSKMYYKHGLYNEAYNATFAAVSKGKINFTTLRVLVEAFIKKT